ncbi:PqqD family peptide modification chaperone [Microbacterium pygmaeum]|uniref:PqqD family peptide modification chaperone n=1 Tax=Microbacterium pygmaeum TaxID=370764 RepID=UPI000B84FF97|nr:PqqD family peptide modification chaperone [Microbacterium pygmaeum]
MAAELLVSALGGLVRIDASSLGDEDRCAVADAWRDALAAEDAADVHPNDDVPIVRTMHDVAQDAMLSDLSQRVTLAAIEQSRGRMWMLHAAGLATDDGRVVALIGPSGRGKTTASRVLGAHFGYVSDETVAIDSDGTVHPYRKPLSVIADGRDYKEQRTPSELGLRALPDAPLRLSAIVLLDRRPDGPDVPVVEPVDLGDALTDLVEQTSYLAVLPSPLQTIAAHVASVGGVQRVIYREAETLVHTIEALAERPGIGGVPPAPVDLEPAPQLSAAAADDALAAVRYTRTDVVDVHPLAGTDRLVLLHVGDVGNGTVRVLGEVASTIWRAANQATLETLVGATVAEYGSPAGADPTELVRSAADEMVDTGILERTFGVDWAIREDVAWVESGDRVVVLGLSGDPRSPQSLEGSAALIWLALVDGGDTATIVRWVAGAAGIVNPAEIADDVMAFLEQLLDNQWVQARRISADASSA